jgi:dihydroorotate dehydrogenase
LNIAPPLPVAVKLSPFFSSLANMAKTLVDAGADELINLEA